MVCEFVQTANPTWGAVLPDAALPRKGPAGRPAGLAIDPKAQACQRRRRAHSKGN